MSRVSKRCVWCLAICLAMTASISLAPNAEAQEQGRRRGGFGGGFGMGTPTMLLGNEQVQKELKITDEQKGKLQPILADARQGGPGGGGPGGAQGGRGGQGLSEEERTKRREEFRKRAEETSKKVEAILTPEQSKRLKEVSINVQGPAALANPEVAKAVKLTDEQSAKIKAVNETAATKGRELFAGGNGGDRAQAREKFAQHRKETGESLLAVLTAEQKAEFEKLKGAKFELDMSQFGRRQQ